MSCENPTCQNDDQLSASLRCSTCKQVFYCSKQCQISHWPLHKTKCASSTKAKPFSNQSAISLRLKELQKALLGRHATVSERITLKLMDDPDPQSKKAKAFSESIYVEEIIQFSIFKFIDTSDKGAVVFNIRYDAPSESQLEWVPRQVFVNSLQSIMVKQVTRYDPAHVCVIFFILPSEDTMSAEVWSLELKFTVEHHLEQQIALLKPLWQRGMDIWSRQGC